MKQREIITLIILLLLVVFLRIPSLFEPYWYGDEGITLTVGQAIRRGAVLYKDIADNKTPFLYFLSAIFYTLPMFRLLLFIWVLILTGVFFFLSKSLLRPRGIIFSSSIFIFLTSLPIMEGNIANGEIFFLLPNALGMLLAWQGYKNKELFLLFLSGISFGLGFLFKVPAVFDFLAVLFFLAFNFFPLRKKLFKSLLFLGLGFVLPNALVIIYFFSHQALSYYWEYGFRWNFVYSTYKNDLLIPYGSLLLRGGLLLVVLLIVFRLRFLVSSSLMLIVLWLLFSLSGSLLSARHYTHYFLPIVPAFSLVVGSIFNFNRKLFWTVVFLLILHRVFTNLGSLKYQLDYYRNFGGYALGKKDVVLYRNFFDPNTDRTYKVSDFLRRKKKGPIFVWGDEPLIYALSERSPVGRFSAAYNIVWEKRRKIETLSQLERERPVFIFVVKPIKFPFYELDKMLTNNYNFVEQIEDVFVYERKN